MCFANAGIPVTVVEMQQEALDRDWPISGALRRHGGKAAEAGDGRRMS